MKTLSWILILLVGCLPSFGAQSVLVVTNTKAGVTAISKSNYPTVTLKDFPTSQFGTNTGLNFIRPGATVTNFNVVSNFTLLSLGTNLVLATDASGNVIGTVVSGGGSGLTNTYNPAQFTLTDGTNVNMAVSPVVTNLHSVGTGASSTAIGTNATATTTSAIAIGTTANASGGSAAIAIGQTANANTTRAIAVGLSSDATGSTALAIGAFTTASGDDSVAIGVNATASGIRSIGLGNGANATADNAVAIGNTASAAGFTNTVAIGRAATATAASQITLGTSLEGVEVPGTANVAGLFTNSVLTASRVVVSGADKALASSVVTSAELAQVSGATGNIQTNLDNRTPASVSVGVSNRVVGLETYTNVAYVTINGTKVAWPVTFTNTSGSGTNANGDIPVGGSGGGTAYSLINSNGAATATGQLVQFLGADKTNTGPVTVGAGLVLSGGTLSVTNATNNVSYAALSTTLNTVTTNGTNSAFAIATVQVLSAPTGTPQIAMYVETTPGTFSRIGLAGAGALASLSTTNTVGGIPIPPNARLYITNESGGTGTTVSIVAASLVTLTGGMGGGSGVSTNLLISTVGIAIDGGGSAITTGTKGAPITIRYDAQIVGWDVASDQPGSIVVDVWKSTGVPTVADAIAGSEKPTLASAQTNADLTLTTWGSTNVTSGDKFYFNVDSATTLTRAVITVILKRLN